MMGLIDINKYVCNDVCMDSKKKAMKRVNVILETELYDKARVVGFIRKKSLSEIVRDALRDWLKANIDERTALVLSEKDERELLRILAEDEFVPLEQAKKELGL
jgi:Arc/MetJ-type ribon-helix-helix transcriptional regulator